MRIGADRAAAFERLHGFFRSDFAADRHRRRRRARPHVPARHGLRSRDDARGARGSGRSRHRRDRGHVQRLRARSVPWQPRAGQPPERRRGATDAALPGAESGRVDQQLHGQPGWVPTTRIRSTCESITTSPTTIASSRGTVFPTTRRCVRHRSTATATAAASAKATKPCACTASPRATCTCSRPTLINEARFGLSREHTNRMPPYGPDTNNLPGQVRHPRDSAGCRQRRPPAHPDEHAVRSRTRRLGRERALQQHAAVQRQPHEGVQVAHLQDRLHVSRTSSSDRRSRPTRAGSTSGTAATPRS